MATMAQNPLVGPRRGLHQSKQASGFDLRVQHNLSGHSSLGAQAVMELPIVAVHRARRDVEPGRCSSGVQPRPQEAHLNLRRGGGLAESSQQSTCQQPPARTPAQGAPEGRAPVGDQSVTESNLDNPLNTTRPNPSLHP